MDRDYERYNVYRILSGVFKIELDEDTYYLSSNTKEDRFHQQELYFEIYRQAESLGCIKLEESYILLADKGGWGSKQEMELKSIPNKIISLKHQIYKSFNTTKIRENLRNKLKASEERHNNLLSKKNSLMSGTCEGIASLFSSYYSMYTKITDKNRQYIKHKFNFEDLDYRILEKAHRMNNLIRLDESEIRTLSRSDSWRNIWSSRENSKGIFNIYADDLDDEQSSLLSWSKFYDDVRSNPDCPPEEILNDHDATDGWIKEMAEKNKEDKKDSKDMTGTEIFLPADTDEEIQRINSMNDVSARMTKRLREKAIDKSGGLNEAELPDVKVDLQRQATQMHANKFRGG